MDWQGRKSCNLSLIKTGRSLLCTINCAVKLSLVDRLLTLMKKFSCSNPPTSIFLVPMNIPKRNQCEYQRGVIVWFGGLPLGRKDASNIIPTDAVMKYLHQITILYLQHSIYK